MKNFIHFLQVKLMIFKKKIIDKFYTNHIIESLNDFQTYFDKEKFATAKFLNSSINLDDILSEEINSLKDEYSNITIDKIQLLYNESLSYLNDVFSFSNIKTKINDEINTFYNSQLYLILSGKIVYDNDKGKTNYDFSNSIIRKSI